MADAAARAAAAPPLLTLDECRDAFYVAQRACERHTASLKAFVDVLDSKKTQADEAWIELVQEEAKKALFFHSNQHAVWDAFSETADAYVDSVRRLAELMAIAGVVLLVGCRSCKGFGVCFAWRVGRQRACGCGAVGSMRVQHAMHGLT